ncbi:ParB/RepB/Spo0J family partition protein [Dietzia sp.]|uniref:ParB/RepB/Spo0J family partition protein n=1 Tax=Dietzia sp. TaxID=1871616 RepID=UPI002FDA1C2A
MAGNNKRSGLGRGIAALIPTADQGHGPSLGDSAADVILGPRTGAGGEKPPRPGVSRETLADRNPSTPPRPAPPRTDGSDDTASASEAPNHNITTNDEGTEIVDPGAVLREIAPAAIEPNPKQPRAVFDEEALAELVHSVREFGLLQPIVVRDMGEGRYQLIMGERRWRASQEAGLETIPAVVRQTADENLLRDALLENIHRVQLNPLEEASAYEQLLEEFGVTQSQLAERIGRSRPAITNAIRLLQLPPAVQRRVAAKVLSAGHARALLSLEGDPQLKEDLAARIIAEGLSVRSTEEIVALTNANGASEEKEKKRRAPAEPDPELQSVANSLSDRFETKVSVAMGKKKGRITIDVGSADDLKRIVKMLKGKR